MAFRSIGTLACAVLREAELRAARQATAANGSGEEPVAQGVRPNSSPMLKQPGGAVASNGDKKDGGSLATPASARASWASGRRETCATDSRLDLGGRLKLVSSICVPRPFRPQKEAFAPRRLGTHLRLVDSHSTFSGLGEMT